MSGYGHGYYGGGKNKVFWTPEEDAKLVDSLMELHVSGKYVYADIEPGYVEAVQQLLDPTLFYSRKPIKNRMNLMKTNFNIVHDMLVGTHMSGFSWDPERSCVVADNQGWDEYIKTHENAAQFRDRPIPHYGKLCIIFDKDHATGVQAVVIGENQLSPCVEVKDLHAGENFSSTNGRLESVSSKRKRDEEKGLSETCVESLEKLKNAIENFGLTFIESLERVANQGIGAVNDRMVKVMTQMEDLAGLTLDERLVAMSVIGRSAALSQMFDRWFHKLGILV